MTQTAEEKKQEQNQRMEAMKGWQDDEELLGTIFMIVMTMCYSAQGVPSFELPSFLCSVEALLSPYDCVEFPDGTRWMVADTSIECSGPGYAGGVFLCTLGWLLIGLGLPLGLFCTLKPHATVDINSSNAWFVSRTGQVRTIALGFLSLSCLHWIRCSSRCGEDIIPASSTGT